MQVGACFVLGNLAAPKASQVKIASMGGIETGTRALNASPEAARLQERGCIVLGSLAVNEDNSHAKTASPWQRRDGVACEGRSPRGGTVAGGVQRRSGKDLAETATAR